MSKAKAAKNYFILPVCLLLLNAVEEVVVYKAQHYPKIAGNPYILTGVLILLFAAGFSLIGDMFAPYMQGVFEHLHKKSKKSGGHVGMIIFYTVVVGIIFLLYFRIYTIGPQSVLPPSWR